MRNALIVIAFACVIAGTGCSKERPANVEVSVPKSQGPRPAPGKTPGPLPPSGYRAKVTLPEPPAKLRTGEQQNLKVHIKNISDVPWWQRGGETNDRSDNKFYIAAASRWLDKDGKHTENLEGHNGIPRDLKPGDEADMTIHINAPKEPGEYVLEVDMVQEGVNWFSDRGSSTIRTKVTVVR